MEQIVLFVKTHARDRLERCEAGGTMFTEVRQKRLQQSRHGWRQRLEDAGGLLVGGHGCALDALPYDAVCLYSRFMLQKDERGTFTPLDPPAVCVEKVRITLSGRQCTYRESLAVLRI